MEVLNDFGLRGKVGNLVFYRVGDRTFARRARSTVKRKRKPRTEAQLGLQRRFRKVQGVYCFLREKVFGDAWTLAGRAEGRRGNAMFHARNCGCFDAEGCLADPAGFQFMGGVEVADDRLLAGTDDQQHLFNSRFGRLLQHILDHRLGQQRHQFLRYRPGKRQHPGTESSRRHHRFAHLHLSPPSRTISGLITVISCSPSRFRNRSNIPSSS